MYNSHSQSLQPEKNQQLQKDSLVSTHSLIKNILSLLVLTTFIFTLSANAKIYKWTDENGKVHYSDKNPDENAKELKISEKNTPNISQKSQTSTQERMERQKKMVSSHFEELEAQKKKQAEEAEKQAKVEKACNQIKSRRNLLNRQARIYSVNEKNEQVFMSDEERAKNIKELNQEIEETCSN